MGVPKDMRSSDSSTKAFVPKEREISAIANWSISISAFLKEMLAALEGRLLTGGNVRGR